MGDSQNCWFIPNPNLFHGWFRGTPYLRKPHQNYYFAVSWMPLRNVWVIWGHCRIVFPLWTRFPMDPWRRNCCIGSFFPNSKGVLLLLRTDVRKLFCWAKTPAWITWPLGRWLRLGRIKAAVFRGKIFRICVNYGELIGENSMTYPPSLPQIPRWNPCFESSFGFVWKWGIFPMK